MKKRLTALALALALMFALGANAVLADDVEEANDAAAAEAAEEAEAADAAETAAGEAEPASGIAGDTEEAGEAAVTVETEDGAAAEEPEPDAPVKPDAPGTLSFYNLESRMRESYYPLLALEENAKTIEEIDYVKLERDLRNGMSDIVDAQWRILGAVGALGSAAVSAMQPTYNTLRDQYDALKDGTMQEDNEGALRQLRSMEDQTVMLAESAYISLIAAQEQDAALSRSIAALDRQIRAAELSRQNGLVSPLKVQQAKNGRAQYASGQQTLRMNVDNGLLQLKVMAGVEQTAPLALAALPKVTSAQLSAMSVEDDLARAKEASYELYAAKLELRDAREKYEDAEEDYGGDGARKDAFVRAKHTWQAAQYNYENTVQSFELKFRTLYAQAKDYAQKLDAAKSALALEEKNYAVSALKYRQGTISKDALADAADTLANAKDTVSGAERDLFSAYRSYQWAVTRGILN